jgi:hypothetical protein
MRFFTWLQRRIRANQSPGERRTRGPMQRFRPRLESLERRDLPSTLYVTSPLDNGSRGTLRYDIAHAASGDTIEMSPTLTAPIVLTQGELLLKRSLTIEGQANQPETISGNNSSRVFEVAARVSVTLMDLDITAGNGLANGSSSNNGYGGGILNFGTLTVSNCTLSGNSVTYANAVSQGGAIYNTGTLTVSNCTLSGNSAAGGSGGIADGGGIANIGGTVTVSNSILSGNSAAYAGGGIFNYVGGKVTVINSILSGNSATWSGGGIATYAATVTIGNTSLSDNSAEFGGAIRNIDAGALALTVSNSLFSGNSPDNILGASTDGGGNTGLT